MGWAGDRTTAGLLYVLLISPASPEDRNHHCGGCLSTGSGLSSIRNIVEWKGGRVIFGEVLMGMVEDLDCCAFPVNWASTIHDWVVEAVWWARALLHKAVAVCVPLPT